MCTVLYMVIKEPIIVYLCLSTIACFLKYFIFFGTGVLSRKLKRTTSANYVSNGKNNYLF